MRPYFSAYRLLINFTAKIGFSSRRGAALLILYYGQSLSVEYMEAADSHLYHAYAPDPIVFETIRKGTLSGNGANCECGTPFMAETV